MAISKEVDEALASIQDVNSPAKGAGALIRAGVPTGPAYNSEPTEPTEHLCNVLYDEFTIDEIDGTLVRASDLKIIVGADKLEIEPTTFDKFKDGDGMIYAILKVTPLRPAGVVVLWELQCRG